MQYTESITRPQLSLFGSASASNLPLFQVRPADADIDSFSELTLSGSIARCQLLLAPVLRELSEAANGRWLTLVAPPASLASGWLRGVELNRERILLLQPRGDQSAAELARMALRSGRSHTVVTWLGELDVAERLQFIAAAQQGGSQGLNIRIRT